MRLLVLGAGGALGSAAARKAVRYGHEVHALLRPATDNRRIACCEEALVCHRFDLEDCATITTLLERLLPQAIVHAAFPGGNPHTPEGCASMLQHGLNASLSLLEALRRVRFDGSLVYLGSSTSYGPTKNPHHPSDPMQPTTFRGVVKAAESLMIGQFARDTQCAVTELRVFSAYGPWLQRERLVSRLLIAALGGERVRLTAKPYFRNWVYVEDIAEACLRACYRTARGAAVFNVCSREIHSNYDVARALEILTGRTLVHSDPYQEQDAYGDPTPFGVPPQPDEGFDWRASYDLARGMEEFWAWATSNAGSSYLLSGAA